MYGKIVSLMAIFIGIHTIYESNYHNINNIIHNCLVFVHQYFIILFIIRHFK